VVLICLTSIMSVGIWYYVKIELMAAKDKDKETVDNDAIELSKLEINLQSKSVSPLHEVATVGK